MDLKLTEKAIKERCGTVSFKRGEAFYRSNKIEMKSADNQTCKAVVRGTEDFFVSVRKGQKEEFSAMCSCPSLASFDRDCQHIAAVLIYILQQNKMTSAAPAPAAFAEDRMADQWISLFDNKPRRTSGQQNHFEDRAVLDIEFTCTVLHVGGESPLLAISVNVEGMPVGDIRSFLSAIQRLHPIEISESFMYNPNLHCFSHEDDAVIQLLIQCAADDHASKQVGADRDHSMLTLPPSIWSQLLPTFARVPHSAVEYDGVRFNEWTISEEPPSLRFVLSPRGTSGFELNVYGLSRLILLPAYQTAFFEGIVYLFQQEDGKRLHYLKQMLEKTQSNTLPIAKDQIGFFMGKVLPGLKKWGRVDIDESIAGNWKKAALNAKLYLDRVGGRLLAGLEFHYENVVINPLENKETKAASWLIRDVEKEEVIMRLMDEFFGKAEEGYFLHNEEIEYEFLTYIVPKLQKMASVYATSAVRTRLFRGNAKPRIRIKAQKDRINWLDFKFEMDGFSEQTIKELLQALEEKRKYYRLPNGSLFSLETREMQEINRFLNYLPEDAGDLSNGFELPLTRSLGLLYTVDEEGVFQFDDTFKSFLDTLKNPNSMSFKVPLPLQHVLRDYQIRGYQWMKTLAFYGFGGILADDMGLGKTIQTIAYLLSEKENIREKQLPALIVCPSSLTYNWLSELTRFAPDLEAIVLDGSKKDRMKLQKDLKGIDIIITSYPLLRSDVKWYEQQAFHSAFFDEAQAFKNPGTQTARTVKKIQANHRFGLTGTPIENAAEELWSIFYVVFPELLGDLKEFSNFPRKSIAKRIRPFVLRRLKEDVLAELPEKVEMEDSVELVEDQKKLYAAYLAKLRHDALKHLDKNTLRKNKIKILAGLTRLRQICCHPALFVDGYSGRSGKFDHLMKVVEESRHAGRRVLVFSQFTKMLNLIGRELTERGLEFFYLDGQTPPGERVERCSRFNQGERDFFLISMKAGGTGLNLTGADTVILYDTWWNPAVEEQAADRAHRMGQKNTVQVIKLVARGTIEEKMNELQEKKKNIIEEIIEQNGESAGTLTEKDIMEILNI
ncbi:SNF2 helicase associated domain-containing protein [Falsibacillus pallidus]|uniref:SNF2 helicase associated domain-containing protein n=1 Tax=Falsibacillus pallidus TaxID=493781 RepID=UPI003D97DAC7